MEAMRPYYITRAIGGLVVLAGAIVGSYNVWMTIRTAPVTQRAGDAPGLPPELAVA